MPQSKNRKDHRRMMAIDAETDPFDGINVPQPFLWCAYDGDAYEEFTNTADFVDWLADQRVNAYAHNGGRFDFAYLLPYIADYMDREVNEIPVRLTNGRILEVRFGHAILRDSLAILPVKLSDFQKTDIEIWKLEREHRAKYWNEIVQYCRDDCANLLYLVQRFRKEAGRRLTIAGNAMAFAGRLGIDAGRTNKHFDDKFRPYYFGGRCEALQTGEFFDCHILDIKSAYPYAMQHFHARGSNYTDFRSHWRTLTRSQLQRAFITLECHSLGAFPKRDKNGLYFPEGFDEFHVTGWEFVAAREHGLISRVRVRHCFVFDESISFSDYVEYWYARKAEAEAAGDKAQRLIAKILLNSLYGKLCQNPLRYCRHKIVPAGTRPDLGDGWYVKTMGDYYDIHAKDQRTILDEQYDGDWQGKRLFYNVATGASITGFTRAMLIDAMARVGRENVIYTDTDSLIVKPGATFDTLKMDGELGAWESEGKAARVYVAGKKLYAAYMQSGDPKIACKGARLSADEIRRIVQNGETIRWENPAPTFDAACGHRWMVREIRATGRA